MKVLFAVLLAAIASSTYAAPNGQALAAKYNCMGCHQVATKIVGPAYKEVADKYRNDKTAANKLAEKVKKGSVGVWGQIPMPAQQIGDADLKLILEWVLSQK
ncbi:c-type cytochrome [Chitinimonas sp. BJB300]|uniref:c-type cytochrome n=1 Tax=Chitinimonas sp. BJB300 TaxID=1559339 RepID=UPI000C114B85|nr:c-type cytochrome [Chitinimonas sp. BJB300]PHV10876.1 cytochrome C [Chitinimonas sp. BJB300]TSJ91312.1 c-type cytochrome [Chitinimonas sp. BJB300]